MARYFYPNARSTTEGAKRIELSWLLKHNYLDGYRGGNISWSRNGSPSGNIDLKINISNNPRVEFSYKIKKREEETWTAMDYSFQMEKVPCYYGGFKWFFVCGLYKDGIYCGRRARVLYEAGNYFGCRKCANLSYESCNESRRFRGGAWRILSQEWRADEYYEKNVKKRFYNGKPTKKYARFLKIKSGYSDRDIMMLEKGLLNLGKPDK